MGIVSGYDDDDFQSCSECPHCYQAANSNYRDYLTDKELLDLKRFLTDSNISYIEFGKKISKTPRTIKLWFESKIFKRSIAREFIKKEKEIFKYVERF